MRTGPWTLRQYVIVVFGAIGVALLPWTLWLSASLSPHHETDHWDLAWSGFDTGLALAFVLTAIAAWRRSAWVTRAPQRPARCCSSTRGSTSCSRAMAMSGGR